MRKKCAGCRKENCNGCSLLPGKTINSIKSKTSLLPENFQPDGQKGFGIAFDIGTTTIAAILAELETGAVLGAKTCVNPQRIAGSDIISRIVFYRESPENAKLLQAMTVAKLDELARELCEEEAEKKREEKTGYNALGRRLAESVNKEFYIKKAAIAGNTAMCEILAGCKLEGLAKAPFHKEYQGCMRIQGSQFSFSFLAETEILLLPAIEGFVGADATAVYTYMKCRDFRENVLAVDIGTNGEILLAGKEKSYACSAAAGPALEGAAVSMGMGAAAGAVEEVRILGSFPRQDICCKVIGEGEPKGICGSGLVDALAALKQLKVMDKTGYLPSAKEARKSGVPEKICRRLSTENEENRILLTTEEYPVYLTNKDIRQLQLAKAAIRAGIEVLLKKAGIEKETLNQIYLAGAFGNYIKVESAVETGLLPPLPKEKIIQAGNCAGAGALMALLSEEITGRMERYAEETVHVELAKEEGFQALFTKYMDFGEIA